MTAEIFKLAMPDRFFLFVAARPERLRIFDAAFRGPGAIVVGPQVFSVVRNGISPEAIRDALGDLEEGECVYVIGAGNEELENHLIVAPRTEGGVAVR